MRLKASVSWSRLEVEIGNKHQEKKRTRRNQNIEEESKEKTWNAADNA